MPAQGRGRKRDGKSHSQTKPQLQLTAVELLGCQGDDGAAVQLAGCLACSCSLDAAALLRVVLQQLGQPHQVTVTEQGVGVQPPVGPRERCFIS